MMHSSHLYPSLSMWNSTAFPSANSQLSTAMCQPSLTPNSGTTSPPTRSYEETTSTGNLANNGSMSPEHQAPYGYPPTPPKEVKAEDTYFSSTGSAISGALTTTPIGENYMATHAKRPEQGSDTYSLPSPTSTATPTTTPTSSSYDMTPYGTFCNFSGIKKSASKGKPSNAATGTFLFCFVLFTSFLIIFFIAFQQCIILF